MKKCFVCAIPGRGALSSPGEGQDSSVSPFQGPDFKACDRAAMNRLARKESVMPIVPFKSLPFIEIDCPEDLEKAEAGVAVRLGSEMTR